MFSKRRSELLLGWRRKDGAAGRAPPSGAFVHVAVSASALLGGCRERIVEEPDRYIHHHDARWHEGDSACERDPRCLERKELAVLGNEGLGHRPPATGDVHANGGAS